MIYLFDYKNYPSKVSNKFSFLHLEAIRVGELKLFRICNGEVEVYNLDSQDWDKVEKED